ncbi:ECF transporter S component [Enterococcus saccharolyticus]|uniref:ECF transporter S component n=1 Tax=Candidatus Enterococcus willemsii TaxID=1857215 RepID=A0ABQ6YY30_9ENTE|nr:MULTISPECIES: ECF transporter S component [Enterococcus]KAF1302393.1 ECF transporter S component [Enterococcus sp. CU12B]MCD5002574.1 ECF transporter S component [Enterococcus saccharolyticus]
MKNTFTMVLTAFFLAILILLASVPFLGFIPLGIINATTLHIPVIIASVVLGPKIGGFLGGCFGIISMIRSTVIITPLSFVFSPFVSPLGTTGAGSWKALLIALIPRILIGVVPYFVYKWCTKFFKNKRSVSLFIAGIAGGLTNTILVMNMIYFLFQKEYAAQIGEVGNAVYAAIITVIFTQGVPEAIVAGIATAAVASVLLRMMKKEPI